MATLFCQKCATEISPNTKRCPTCGAKIEPIKEDNTVVDVRFDDAHRFKDGVEQPRTTPKDDATGSPRSKKGQAIFGEMSKEMQAKFAKYGLVNDEDFLLAGLSLFIPIVGFIIAASIKKQRPELAKSLNVLAGISVFFAVVSSF